MCLTLMNVGYHDVMDDVGECHLVYDLWIFEVPYKAWKPFEWFLQCLVQCGFFHSYMCVVFRKALSQVKLLAATYPNMYVFGPVLIDGDNNMNICV